MSEENVNPATPVAPAPKKKSAEDELANKLCIASLICYGAPTVLSIIAAPFITALETAFEDSAASIIFLPLGLIVGLGPIAAIILMIIARVKSPKNTFAKVLMWIYIALFILKLLAVFFIILFFAAAFASCAGEFN